MDKKIGIMSMQRIINYGSFLQAYGLKKMIESISKSEVEFVDYRFGTDITDRLKRKQERTESVMDKVLKNRTPWNYLKKMQFFKEIERRLIQDLKAMGVDELNYDCRVDTLVIGSDEVFNCLQPYPVGYSKNYLVMDLKVISLFHMQLLSEVRAMKIWWRPALYKKLRQCYPNLQRFL